MEVIIIILTLVAVVAAVLVVPEIRKYFRLDKKPKLKIEGMVGQLEKSIEFNTFIQNNDGKIVFIDIYIPEEEFDGIIEGETPYFVLYDECDDLEDGEKPSIRKCSGIEYNINNYGKATDYAFYFMRGFYKLRGYFAILGFEGPHQGLMGASLKPVNYENVKL
jgi:hypothetical protein